MTRKHTHHQAIFTPAELLPRIERARREGRFQQALELAKQLHKYEPTPEHVELLKEVYLGRARQLRTQGQSRDAMNVLDVAAHLDETTPAWLERLAEEMALCGEVGRSLALIEKLPDPSATTRLHGYLVDAAMQQEAAGRAALPPALREDFDRIVLAFEQSESGQDDAARATLQGIGLRSPFLEWKLLLRGLQAYWHNDDVRALENWQRLTPERLPARLAAPFRLHLDAAFRGAQPPAMQAVLQKQSDQLQGSPLLVHLRTLQATMADKSKMATAFRQAEALLPSLRQEAPQLLPRLARCFYWTVLETGPDDVLRYQRVFGKPPDDPNFHRLQALGYERGGDLDVAHSHWQQYEKEIAERPENWPGDQADHARALVWQRMGENAASIPDSPRERRQGFDPFGLDEALTPLNPSAEKCLQKSLQLAPDLLDTHEALIRYHREGKRDAKAEKAALELLNHFPDHVPTLELLGDLRRKHGDYSASLDRMQQALRGNALDRRLRRKVGEAHLLVARLHTQAGRFDEARQQFQAASDLSNGADSGAIAAYRAACEFKAGETDKGEELVQQAMTQAPAAVGIAYLLTAEIARLKLPRALKTRFEEELQRGLTEPSPAGSVFLARILAGMHTDRIQYIGQKGHSQKVRSYIHKTRDGDFSETQLEELCQNLLDLEDYPKVRRFAELAERQYPTNPAFPYLHALGWIRAEGRRVQPYQVVPLLQRAKVLLHAQPPNERRDRTIEEIEKLLHEVNPFDLDFLRGFFENLAGGAGEDFDDGEDDW